MVKVFPLIGNKSVLTSPIKHCTSNFSVIRQEEKKKGIQIGREEIKLHLFTDRIAYVENLEGPTQKLLELISKFRRVLGYKINIEKKKRNQLYLLTNNWKSFLKHHLQQHHKIKYLGTNLTKKVQDLYDAKYKTLMKEIRDLSRCRDMLCL